MRGGGTVWLSALFVNQGEQIRWYQDDVGRLILIILKIFVGFYSRHPETFKPDDAQGSSLLSRGDRVRWRGEVSWLSHFNTFKTLKFG